VTDRRTLTRRGLMGAAGGAAAVGALGPVSGLAGAHDRDRRGRGRGREDDGRGRRGDIPADRIGIQVFTVRDLLADSAGTAPVRRFALGPAGRPSGDRAPPPTLKQQPAVASATHNNGNPGAALDGASLHR
jgi:hypothetical protein